MAGREVYETVEACRRSLRDGDYKEAADLYDDAIRKVTAVLRTVPSSDMDIYEKIITMLEKERSKLKENDILLNEKLVLEASTPEAPPADPNVWPEPERSRSKSVNRNRTSKPPRVIKTNDDKKKDAGKPPKKTTPAPASKRRPGYDDLNKDTTKIEDESMEKEENDKEYFISLGYDRDLVTVMESTMLRNLSNVTWDSVAGLQSTKDLFINTVILPSIMPDFFTGLRRPWKAVCMVGPPGTGKTLLAKAVAAESKTTFFSVACGDLASKWRGDAEKMVKLLFEMARHYAPSTIFIDEIDTIGSQRGGANEHEASRRLKAQLLVEMDGFSNSDDSKRVFVLAATNHPWILDEALRRRFEKRIYIPLPDQETRLALLESALKEMKVCESLSLPRISELLEGFSGADVLNVCRQAAFVGFSRLTKGLSFDQITQMSKDKPNTFDIPITMEHFEEALSSTNPSVSAESVHEYEDWMRKYGAF